MGLRYDRNLIVYDKAKIWVEGGADGSGRGKRKAAPRGAALDEPGGPPNESGTLDRFAA